MLFVDADTELSKNFLENIIEVMQDPKVVCASGYIKTRGNIFERFLFRASSELAWLLSIIRYPHFYGNCLACKKDAFEKIGGFNEELKTCEDLDLTKRISKLGKCILVRRAIAYSSPRRVRKTGALRIAIFHIINFFKYKLLKRPREHYPIVR